MESEKSEVVITLRVSKELHEAIKNAAHEQKTSMNQFIAQHLRSILKVSDFPKHELM